MLPLSANYLVPPLTFMVEVVTFLGLFVFWPLIQAVRAGRPGWALVVVVFPVLGALLWWTAGRSSSDAVPISG